jgi:hypothetical protein
LANKNSEFGTRMSKRDYIKEIKELRERNPQPEGPFDEANDRFFTLKSCTNELAKCNQLTVMQQEFLRYASVGAIAFVEGYFKGLIRELVDLGSPYRDNIVNIKELKLTTNILVALHSGKATLGEFISHFISISSLKDVDKCMSAILGIEFIKQLKQNVEIEDETLAGVSRAFELRHIIAHELAPNVQPTVKEADDCVTYSYFLIAATELFWREILQD